MHRRLKERLIGAAVLVMLAVIFIPMILDDTSHIETTITDTNIPSKPEVDFSSRMVPVLEPSNKEIQSPPVSIPANPADEAVTATAAPAGPAQVISPLVEKVSNAATTTGREDLGLSAWVVQLGSFSDEVNAESLNKKLRLAGFTAFVEPLKQNNSLVYRVRVGPELLRADADKLQSQLHVRLHLDGIVVAYP